jgi:hypothetical protein
MPRRPWHRQDLLAWPLRRAKAYRRRPRRRRAPCSIACSSSLSAERLTNRVVAINRTADCSLLGRSEIRGGWDAWNTAADVIARSLGVHYRETNTICRWQKWRRQRACQVSARAPQAVPERVMSFSLQPAINAIEPRCLLDVLSEQLMRTLMQGFFLREGTGIALLYDDGDESRPFRRLDPFPRGDRRLLDNFSQFCAAYRQNAEHNALCQECDEKHAREAYRSSTQEVLTYSCHMGLEDFCRPLFVGGRVRGVLFAGQIILNCESALQRVNRAIDEHIVEAERATLRKHAEDSAIAFAAADARRASFKQLANGAQQALDQLFQATCDIAIQAALGELSESLTGALGTQRALGVISDVVEELGRALAGAPVALLTRHKSEYRVEATVPVLPDGAPLVVPANEVVAWPQDTLSAVDRPSGGLVDLLRALGGLGERAQLYRLDLPGHPELGISTLVLLGKAPRRSLRSVIVRCCHTLADRMNVHQLVLAMLEQQTNSP